jgi:hypothetical protein
MTYRNTPQKLDDQGRPTIRLGLGDVATRPTTAEQSQRLWAMTAAQRVAAMQAGRLSMVQCCEWAAQRPDEVPLINGEFAFIADRTPEVAETDDEEEGPQSEVGKIAQPSVRQRALDFLSPQQRAEILAGTIRVSLGDGVSGPLSPSVSVGSGCLEVHQYTAQAWNSLVRWHTYCRQHGYPTGERSGAEGYPPRPSRDHEIVRVTWRQVREWVVADDSGQTTLFGEH